MCSYSISNSFAIWFSFGKCRIEGEKEICICEELLYGERKERSRILVEI